MLHQISLYLAEQQESPRCGGGDEPSSTATAFTTLFGENMFFCLLACHSIQLCLWLFTSGLYLLMTTLQNIDLIYSLLWPQFHFSKLPYIKLIYTDIEFFFVFFPIRVASAVPIFDRTASERRARVGCLAFTNKALLFERASECHLVTHNNMICTQRNHADMKGISCSLVEGHSPRSSSATHRK